MKNFNNKQRVILVVIVLLLLVSGFFFWKSGIFAPAPEPIPAPAPSSSAASSAPPVQSEPPASSVPEDDGLPHDKLFVTMERHEYVNGDLILVIPKLGINVSLLGEGTAAENLDKGPALYEYSQLPGEGNRNVSVTAHRDSVRKDKEIFYYLDTLTDGDYFYLADSNHIYRYLYETQFVIEPDDWGPIYSQGYSCLTLTTCTPPRTATHRLVVRGRLDTTVPYADDYAYEANDHGGEPLA